MLVGHAVRALYCAASVVDLALDTRATEMLAAVERQQENTEAALTYNTGGLGSRHTGEAYCESYAVVAFRMLYCRVLLLATGKAGYADLIERTLYNIVASASFPDSRAFCYAHTLHRRSPDEAAEPQEQSKRADSSIDTIRGSWRCGRVRVCTAWSSPVSRRAYMWMTA
ncbi:beta-L-arabinofuranosidase domain-containing protein [Arthrobacter psychrochitiniphilus]|uniref:beta-L-arabinofuranosidase domain-containing protein n=1 Tax=Arthrobacter psychrochitiniphilus TaxID=291045 RepID=UPI00147292FA|nr:DUF1680 family protein [Arthrobacter psychrochitiniphilus]